MKKIFLLGLFLVLSVSCSRDEYTYYNPYLPEMNVYLMINLNLPSYAVLNYVNNSILETSQGINGVIVHNTGMGFVAYDATCSNHAITAGSALTVNGQLASCNHCDREYFLLNGQPTSETETSQYFLKPYLVNVSGNVLTISNY